MAIADRPSISARQRPPDCDIVHCWFSRLIFCEEWEAAMNLSLESGSSLNNGASETGLT
jgi:hypothetical protein